MLAPHIYNYLILKIQIPAISKIFPPVHQIPTQIVQNSHTIQPIPLEIAFHLSISPELHPSSTIIFELDYCEKKEEEWKFIKGKTEQSIINEAMNARKDIQYTTNIVGEL